MALFNIVQGLISTIMNAAGFGSAAQTVLPQEIVTAVEDCGFFESIPLWAVTLIGGLFHHDIVIHYDYVGVRKIFPFVSLYRNRSRSSFHFLRESRARVSARALSSLMPPSVWRVQSLCLPVSSFHSLRLRPCC